MGPLFFMVGEYGVLVFYRFLRSKNLWMRNMKIESKRRFGSPLEFRVVNTVMLESGIDERNERTWGGIDHRNSTKESSPSKW